MRRARTHSGAQDKLEPLRTPLLALLLLTLSLAGCAEGDGMASGTNGTGDASEAAAGSEASDEVKEIGASGRASGSATTSKDADTKPKTQAKTIGDESDPQAPADAKPSVKITASTITGLVPLSVDVVIEVKDPEHRDTMLHYDMGLGEDGEGGVGDVKIAGAGSLSLTVEYTVAGTYTIFARADDATSSGRHQITVTALSGCPDDDSLLLIDDKNTDSESADWEPTCMTAHVQGEGDEKRLHLDVYFAPQDGQNASTLAKPKGILFFKESKNIGHENRIVLTTQEGEYVHDWERKTVTWADASNVDPVVDWDQNRLSFQLLVSELDEGGALETGDRLSDIRFDFKSTSNLDDRVGTIPAELEFTDDGVVEPGDA